MSILEQYLLIYRHFSSSMNGGNYKTTGSSLSASAVGGRVVPCYGRRKITKEELEWRSNVFQKAKALVMEERLISAVSVHPELYNSTLSSYKDLDKKAAAWRAVSLQVELPEEDCRKKWKSLRDGFIKDKRSEERRLASGGIHRCWKYSQHMAFLTPFIQSRTSTTSSATDDLCDGRDWEGDSEVNSHSASMLHGREAELSDADTPPGFPHAGSPALKRTRWQGEGLEGTEDELFLMSLLPHLKRLPYEKKCAVKLKFHQLLYEAEFHKVGE